MICKTIFKTKNNAFSTVTVAHISDIEINNAPDSQLDQQ